MSYFEKNTWAFGLIVVVTYAVYLLMVAPQVGSPITGKINVGEISYAPAMVATIAGAVVAGILAGIVLGIFSPKESSVEDERERQISRFGDRIGNAFVVIGGVSAMVLAMMEADWFWIANAVYLCFVVSGVLSTVAKIAAYRKGLPSW